jgi:hypothetical protein
MELEDKIIKIKGYEVIISSEDYDRVIQHKWHIRSNLKKGGAYFTSYAGNRRYLRLHDFIMNCPKGMCVDHINGNTLDNRRSNLRICTNHQNIINRSKQCRNTSGYKGVSWHKHNKKWQTTIQINGEKMYLGQYHDIEEAHKAYCEAAVKYFGEFARFG